MRKRFTVPLMAIAALLVQQVGAEVTYDLQVGPLEGVTSARGVLVADVSNNGFSAIGPWSLGTLLQAGETIGGSDDLIVAVFGTSSGLPWPSDTGFAEVFSSSAVIPEGADLAFFWIEGSDSGPATIEADTELSRIISTDWQVPSDGATARISSLTSALGGSLSPGDIETVNSGNTPSSLSFNSPTQTTIEAGGTRYFSFEGQSGRGIVLDLNGNESVSGAVYDEAGNLIENFDGSRIILSNGTYLLALTETSGVSPASLNFVLVDSEFQPDLYLSGGKVRSKRGNLYSSNPASQRYPIKVNGRASFSVILENDSFLNDSLKLAATRLPRPFRQTISDHRGNVLSLVLAGRYFTGDLDGRSARSLTVRVKGKRSKKKRRYSKKQYFYAQSAGDPSKRDALTVILIAR